MDFETHNAGCVWWPANALALQVPPEQIGVSAGHIQLELHAPPDGQSFCNSEAGERRSVILTISGRHRATHRAWRAAYSAAAADLALLISGRPVTNVRARWADTRTRAQVVSLAQCLQDATSGQGSGWHKGNSFSCHMLRKYLT